MPNSLQTLKRPREDLDFRAVKTTEAPTERSEPFSTQGPEIIRDDRGRILDADGRQLDKMAQAYRDRIKDSHERLESIGDNLGERILRMVAKIDPYSLDAVDQLEKKRQIEKDRVFTDELNGVMHYYENQESYYQTAIEEAVAKGRTITVAGEEHLGAPEDQIPEWLR